MHLRFNRSMDWRWGCDVGDHTKGPAGQAQDTPLHAARKPSSLRRQHSLPEVLDRSKPHGQDLSTGCLAIFRANTASARARKTQ